MIKLRSALAGLAALAVSASALGACEADLDGDGVVGFNDLVSLLSQ